MFIGRKKQHRILSKLLEWNGSHKISFIEFSFHFYIFLFFCYLFLFLQFSFSCFFSFLIFRNKIKRRRRSGKSSTIDFPHTPLGSFIPQQTKSAHSQPRYNDKTRIFHFYCTLVFAIFRKIYGFPSAYLCMLPFVVFTFFALLLYFPFSMHVSEFSLEKG